MEFALSEILYFNFIVIFSYLVQQKGSIALLHRWILLLTLEHILGRTLHLSMFSLLSGSYICLTKQRDGFVFYHIITRQMPENFRKTS